METIRTDNFVFEKETYEIKLYRTANGYKVISYKNGKKANPYNYNVSFAVGQDYEVYHGEKGYEKLIKIAKDDIKQGLVFGKKFRKL